MKFSPSPRLLAAAALCGSMCAWSAPTLADLSAAMVFGQAAPLALDDLAGQRGGTQVEVLNQNWLDGALHDNQAINVQSGSNLIGGGAFAGASGFVTAIQNSGSNVLLQSATIINVQVQ